MDEYHLCVRGCVRVRVCLDLCFPVKERALACDCACVYQQESFSRESEGQLVIWSAASPVVVTAADCHEKRGDARRGGEFRGRTVRLGSLRYLSNPMMGKTQ